MLLPAVGRRESERPGHGASGRHRWHPRTRDDLVDALAKQRQRRVTNTLVFSRIIDPLSEITSKSVALIESTQRQQTGVTADLPTGKISVNGSMSVEGENQ
jgi:hypothetical protein